MFAPLRIEDTDEVRRHSYATLKVFTRECDDPEEFNIYNLLSAGDASHPGHRHIRTALDVFTLPRQDGDHKCLVQKPMWDSFRDLLNRNPAHRFPTEMLRPALCYILFAIDYLHSECKLVHTGGFSFFQRLCYTNAIKDIKADNILIDIADQDILDSFVNAELKSPSPRKIVDGAPVYQSRRFDRPKNFGFPVLSDFGSAVSGELKRAYDAQPDVYRCPEVMLETEWSYPADIWNLGAMVG